MLHTVVHILGNEKYHYEHEVRVCWLKRNEIDRSEGKMPQDLLSLNTEDHKLVKWGSVDSGKD